ncbi:hypothetical protein [Mycetocola spongiae]|uniref:hypothetical protein n=1 Tax=Mycetocola spongiae TaxID=2859226 RepID=UPI001CF2679F|nr:hypothetical protein [Mycetocola spongiae]UCR90072.1 hypothetical protein KXZ72_05245 [Mycetocola spongiae]
MDTGSIQIRRGDRAGSSRPRYPVPSRSGWAAPLGLCLVATLLLTGCGSPEKPLTAASNPGSIANLPVFEGHWAEDFSYQYRTALSDDHRRALADGKISEAEFAEVQDEYLECVRATGIRITPDEYGGGASYTAPAGMGTGTANEIETRCSHSSGESTIGALYQGTMRNPENLDNSRIVAQCLVDRGLVEKGYNASRYDAQPVVYDDLIDQNIDNFKRADECIRDPLGILAAHE